jgi:3-oxoacyl-(acyl-carrier-protein) synthase
MRGERRAWVRSVGVVSALGGWPATAAALAQGRSGIAPITRFDATGMPCGVASVVDDAPPRGDAPEAHASDRTGDASGMPTDVAAHAGGRPVAVEAEAGTHDQRRAEGSAERGGSRPLGDEGGPAHRCTQAAHRVAEACVSARLDGDAPMAAEASATDRRTQLAQRAVAEAWAAARLDGARLEGGARIGVFVGAESGLACWEAAWALSRAGGGAARLDRAAFAAHPDAVIAWADPRRTSTAAVAWAIARQVGARGPCRTIALACASGAAAILEAVRALAAGACDAAVCVGVGADVDPLMVAAFGRLGALSTRGRSVPFDHRRDGFVLGEGAAALVLSADRGDATVYVAGGARTFDGGKLTAPGPDGGAAQRAIAGAIDDAGRARIGYVAAHGTSTPSGDVAEAHALRTVLGADLGGARVGAVKSALGHWIAGSGALGAVCAWHAVAHDQLLPTIGVERISDDCELPHVLHTAKTARIDAALACSFGFGGANACVVLRRAA